MFEHLSKYRVVLVSGPARSGTTICGKMIASDTGHVFWGDDQYPPYDIELWEMAVSNYYSLPPRVIQCAGMTSQLHRVTADDVMIVYMHRPLTEIWDSKRRAGWTTKSYDIEWSLLESASHGATNTIALDHGMLSLEEFQYWFWHHEQRKKCINKMDQQYHALASHPLWVPQRDRVDWHQKQTERTP